MLANDKNLHENGLSALTQLMAILPFLKGRTWRSDFLLALLLLLFFLSPAWTCAQSPAKQPTPSDKVTRIAYVDHGRLRLECKGLIAARQEAKAAWQTSEQDHRKQLAGLDKAERQALEQSQQERRRQLHLRRVAALQAQERRIVEAIGEVVSLGGFTDVRPLEKASLPDQGQDITDLVLQKLN